MLVVKKFGGTSVANKERIFNVAKRCIEDYKKGNQVAGKSHSYTNVQRDALIPCHWVPVPDNV